MDGNDIGCFFGCDGVDAEVLKDGGMGLGFCIRFLVDEVV